MPNVTDILGGVQIHFDSSEEALAALAQAALTSLVEVAALKFHSELRYAADGMRVSVYEIDDADCTKLAQLTIDGIVKRLGGGPLADALVHMQSTLAEQWVRQWRETKKVIAAARKA